VYSQATGSRYRLVRSPFSSRRLVSGADSVVHSSLEQVQPPQISSTRHSQLSSVRIVSAAVLVLIAILGLRKAHRGPTQPAEFVLPDRRELAGTYARFLGLTVINPATVFYFAAFIVGLGVANDMTPSQGALFVTGAFLASLSWQSLLAGVGAFAGHRLPPKTHKAAIVTGNVLILAIAGLILLQ
jgi:arginine exporter protein ArgO